jgi:hypothetical protein
MPHRDSQEFGVVDVLPAFWNIRGTGSKIRNADDTSGIRKNVQRSAPSLNVSGMLIRWNFLKAIRRLLRSIPTPEDGGREGRV